MSQNTSSAVMQQRSEAHDSLDDFPTPPWATRALFEHIIVPELGLLGRRDLRGKRAWEPCANRGFMFMVLKDYFGQVLASDIHDYGMGYPQHDFLMPFVPGNFALPHWIVTNPPFRLAEQIIRRSRSIARDGVAMLVRTSFLEGVGRWEALFNVDPPSVVAQFVERVPMWKGQLTATGSTATSYCWLVWLTETRVDTRLRWIPPCRRALELPEDYPA